MRALVVRVVRVAGERVVEVAGVGAECVRGLRVGQARCGGRAGLGEHALFHDQLRAGGVPDAAVPLVDAAAIGAEQAARHFGQFGGLQAEDRLELAAQRAVGQVFEQRGGCGGVSAGAGQDAA